MKELMAGYLAIKVFDSRDVMGRQAALDVSFRINSILKQQEMVNIVFAAAPSQNEFLFYLKQQPGIDWRRVQAFHMDEYIGLNDDDKQRFGNYLKKRIFNEIPIESVHYINGNSRDPERECRRYATLLHKFPADIVCMGIGENAHLAFNDPPVADFKDPADVKIVTLEQSCRQQQVNDGCFSEISEVPQQAITLTIPTLMRSKFIFCMVPGERKAGAVFKTINDRIEERTPSTILRTHRQSVLYLDSDSSKNLELKK